MASVQSLLAQIAANTAKQQAAAAAQSAAAPHAMNPQLAAQASQAAKAASLAQSAELAGTISMIGTAVNIVTDAVKNLISQADQLKAAVMSSVEAYKPFQVYLFTRRLMDLQAVFGAIFLPVLLKFKQVLRDVADYFYNLPEGFSRVLRAIAAVAVAVSVFTAVAAVVVALGVALAGLLLTPVQLIVGLAALTYAFLQSAGGVKFLKKAIEFVEQAFAFISDRAQLMWEMVQPIIDLVSEAFDDLGSMLSSLMDDLSPLMDLLSRIGGGILLVIATVVGLIVAAITKLVQALIWWFSLLSRLTSKLLGAFGLKLPEVEKTNKSAFGLAAQGGSISGDVSGMKTKLEEIILANTGQEKQDPAKDTAKNTAQIAADVTEIKSKMNENKQGGRKEKEFGPAGDPAPLLPKPDVGKVIQGLLLGN